MSEPDELGDGGPYRAPGERFDEEAYESGGTLQIATGAVLDSLVEWIGLERAAEETDEALRARACEKLRAFR